MKISHVIESRDCCAVCGQTPCNCTHISESTAQVEAYGYVYNRRDQRVMWRKIFSSEQAAHAWADKNNATVMGIRTVEQGVAEATELRGYFFDQLAAALPVGLSTPEEIIAAGLATAKKKMDPVKAVRLFRYSEGFEDDLIRAYKILHNIL